LIFLNARVISPIRAVIILYMPKFRSGYPGRVAHGEPARARDGHRGG
jgi:hypothetical protein